MSRKWWFILTAMLVMATLYRNQLHAYLKQASANVCDFDLPSAGAYDALVATVLEGFYARVAGEVGSAHPGGNLLEVGSGPGRLAVRLAREDPTMTLTGVDISEAMVERAARRAAGVGSQRECGLRSATSRRCRSPRGSSTGW
jgi:2-polyprenyl-3-methyl-5-hydroxy-6-metoxy-1,4-benzoquinol methylase